MKAITCMSHIKYLSLFNSKLYQIILESEIDALKMKLSSGHAIALWKKRCGTDQKRLII